MHPRLGRTFPDSPPDLVNTNSQRVRIKCYPVPLKSAAEPQKIRSPCGRSETFHKGSGKAEKTWDSIATLTGPAMTKCDARIGLDQVYEIRKPSVRQPKAKFEQRVIVLVADIDRDLRHRPRP